MQKLSMLTKARTLDGGYYTARQLPILKESGIWTIDAVKHADPRTANASCNFRKCFIVQPKVDIGERYLLL